MFREASWICLWLLLPLLVTVTPQSQMQRERQGEVSGQTTWSLRSFRAVGDGRTDSTAAMQRAVEQVSRHHGTLVVPAGTFVIGTVELRSHMTLRLEHGAVLRTSASPAMA